MPPSSDAPAANSPTDRRLLTLGDFLRRIGVSFPKAKDNRERVKDHPLNQMANIEFTSMLQKILDEIGWGQFRSQVMLSIGGHWRITPLIWAVLNGAEEWEQTRTGLPGRVMLQISYSEDFTALSMGVVLQYNLPGGRAGEDRLEASHSRYVALKERLGVLHQGAQVDLPAFRNWNYTSASGLRETLWSKPVLAYVYQTNNLPEDAVLKDQLRSLFESVLPVRS